MIRIHNRSTYNRIYSSFCKDFIDTFVCNRRNGLNTDKSLQAARMAVQMRASLEIAENRPNKLIAIQAYKNIKSDTKLIERAIRFYNGMK